MGMFIRTPSNSNHTATEDLSSRNEKGLMSGDGDGRPPAGMVVPGDHDVPAGAISRANISSACLTGWSTTIRTITSRAAAARECGP